MNQQTNVIRCGTMFDPGADIVISDAVIVMQGQHIVYAGHSGKAPAIAPEAKIIDYNDAFVMPGLIDAHVHLSYGEAKTEEDIDLFASLEFRALRGMEAAQRILRAGYTSVCDPTTSGRVSLAIRDAIDAGLFVGPRVTCSGRNISSRQGLVDWYPTWVGVPDTSIGQIVHNKDEGLDAIRQQVKDGVDFIKLSMDGDSMNPSSIRLACAFRQDEVDLLVDEAHRLGRKVVVHARGAEGVLHAARADADLIFHASYMDEQALEAVIENDCALCPTLSLLVNNIEFAQPSDPSYPALVDAHKHELDAAAKNLSRAREAGVRFLIGSEAGFAVTPYGEWHARELENHMKYIGFSEREVLRQATVENAWFTQAGSDVGSLTQGSIADILVLAQNPLEDISVPLDPANILAVYKDGATVDLTPNHNRSRLATEFSYAMWNDVYTRDTLAARNGIAAE
ncbi:metal-dependent hydrolase family protein [Parasphingopyxis lamellibrachiae]|uniref:Imidazolonepropionase-like amidohydrolase n=1 Tax=Parasphingopyxis lamellibrachiae TaxID=680125 RepID=A0A3D9F893_9SPHN|nr:amidohydrolase family protein [Parasphingopyxis lamellibrachiae]RED13356.1 imidazolonepropionase-like amidohydrolase [Parasphingopyxis lamellibrachiae]